MVDQEDPTSRLGRLRALPRRTRGVVVRLLRQPAEVERLRADVNATAAVLPQEIEALRRQVVSLRTEVAQHQATSADAWRRVGSTMATLIAQAAAGDINGTPSPDDPLVSIILAVRDRPTQLRRAVTSVVAQTYTQWELVIIDDDGTDDPALALGPLASDPRVHVLRSAGAGVAAARNQGIGHARGDIVAFLDSDNWWYPRRLEAIVLGWSPHIQWAIDQQLVLASGSVPHHVRDIEHPTRELAVGNFIDLGAVVVRRQVLDELCQTTPEGSREGPFDTELKRLSDWELIQRLAARADPHRIPYVGHVYDDRPGDRISLREPFGPAYHRIRSRGIGRSAEGLRILVSEWHFPQITETYIQSDIAGLRALGAEVEVWSSEDVAVYYEPGVPWRRGSLEDHINDFRPDLVLSHWLHVGRDHRPITRRLGIPHAVRCHGFDFNEGIIEELAKDPEVVIHLFPHLLGRFSDRPNVVVDPVGFDPSRVAPTSAKDRQLVLRLVAGLHTKDLETFMLAASRCPEFRFVLGIGHSYQAEERTEELIQQAKDLGAPVEILTDLTYEKAAAITMDAGIYLHTHGEAHVVGMPISPVEAMATGALVLVRTLPGAEILGDGVMRYHGSTPEERADHAAALINDTLHWSDGRWARQARMALDVAWTSFPADLVANDLLTTWREHFRLAPRRTL